MYPSSSVFSSPLRARPMIPVLRACLLHLRLRPHVSPLSAAALLHSFPRPLPPIPRSRSPSPRLSPPSPPPSTRFPAALPSLLPPPYPLPFRIPAFLFFPPLPAVYLHLQTLIRALTDSTLRIRGAGQRARTCARHVDGCCARLWRGRACAEGRGARGCRPAAGMRWRPSRTLRGSVAVVRKRRAYVHGFSGAQAARVICRQCRCGVVRGGRTTICVHRGARVWCVDGARGGRGCMALDVGSRAEARRPCVTLGMACADAGGDIDIDVRCSAAR
ncbi:hypothetical protein DFH09DRAFT_1154732 [Mycena vulgaris]|nr:hypothetical protein DFH09DRAFT_1154732 [Mycena vulgaris]